MQSYVFTFFQRISIDEVASRLVENMEKLTIKPNKKKKLRQRK